MPSSPRLDAYCCLLTADYRLADLTVDHEVIKDTVMIQYKTVSGDAPCDAPCAWCTPHITYARCDTTGHHPHQAPADACYVEEGCLGGTGTRKVHLAISQSIINMQTYMHKTLLLLCRAHARHMHGVCTRCH